MSKLNKYVMCCFCGAIIPEYRGNNPAPLDNNPYHYCCNLCNYTKVIPERLKILRQESDTNEEEQL